MMRETFNYSLLGLGLFLFFACNSAEKQSEIPVVDVTKSYPKKEIILQDIAEVEYIPLETRGDVLVGLGDNIAYVSDKIIIGSRVTGDVYIFDGQGKILHKFNHKGQSGREYTQLWNLIYDGQREELYVIDIIFRHRIQVYNLQGKYKRSINFPETVYCGRESINFNSKSLLCYDEVTGEINIEDATKSPFKFIDKQTGQVLDSITLPFGKRVSPIIKTGTMSSVRPKISPIVSYNSELVLSEISCDTIFLLSKDKKLTPLITRTPKVANQTSPSHIFQVSAITPKYIFSNIVRLEANGPQGYPPTTYLAIDRKTSKVLQYRLQNSDALGVLGTATKKRASLIDAATLIEALGRGKLKGKLKELAEKLDEEDNPVLVKVRFKE